MAIYYYFAKEEYSILGISPGSKPSGPVKGMKTSQRGINLIKRHEKFMPRSYDDKQPWLNISSSGQVKGKLTIGYGHTKKVSIGQVISELQGEQLLVSDLLDSEKVVKSKVKINLTQNQFDALVSYVFNTGGSTNLFALVNGMPNVIFNNQSYDLKRWWNEKYITSNGQFMNGLVTRRAEEYEIFIS
jgi:lysozyme